MRAIRFIWPYKDGPTHAPAVMDANYPNCENGKRQKSMAKVVNVIKKSVKNLLNKNKTITFAATFKEMVPWMSGLVNGLQNRLRRFESARHL